MTRTLRARIVIIFSVFTICTSRQPMLREDEEITLPHSASSDSLSQPSQSSWMQSDGPSAKFDQSQSSTSSDGRDIETTGPATTSAQPDSTGLVGGTLSLENGRPMLSLNLWVNQRRSQLKPRRRDMHEGSLMKQLGSDYQPGWMRRSREGVNQESPLEERPAVRALRQLVNSEGALGDLRLPSGLSPEARQIVSSWLVKRATCPVRFIWADLGPYFWPRWLRRGECGQSGGDMDDVIDRGDRRNTEDDDELSDDDDYMDTYRAAVRTNSTDAAKSCSWPPGMKCVPGVARTLHLLRWHCRLRKHGIASYNTILSGSKHTGRPGAKPKVNARQKRSKYRCVWIKVPYSVAEDCVCSV